MWHSPSLVWTQQQTSTRFISSGSRCTCVLPSVLAVSFLQVLPLVFKALHLGEHDIARIQMAQGKGFFGWLARNDH